MSKFVSFHLLFKNGESSQGNMVLSDFDIQSNSDIEAIESVIKSECNYDNKCNYKSKVDVVTLINWKSL